MNRVLGGESLVAVRVEPAWAAASGECICRRPAAYEGLIAQVSGAVLQAMPAHYELVVHGAPAPAGR